MNLLEIILLVYGSLCVLAIIAYAIAFDARLLVSRIETFPVLGPADHYYFLPTARMKLTVTALIKIEKSAVNNTIVSNEVLQLTFAPEVEIIPDSSTFVRLNYQGNWFFNDEVQMSTSTSGLLENIKAVSEDRLGEIVARITQAAKGDESTKRNFKVTEKAVVPATKLEVKEVVNVFIISEKELATGVISKVWRIVLNGPAASKNAAEADASFTLRTGHTFTKKVPPAGREFSGLLTRPLMAQEWKLDSAVHNMSSFICLVPNTESLLMVPVRRAFFVKKQQVPKFQKGLLIENSISKPSEFEGLVSIPINILKAIVSIPAQLFQFKLSRIKDDTELQKALNELAKAREEASNTGNNSKITELEKEIARLKKKESEETAASQSVEDDETPRFGKLPPKKFEEPEEERNARKALRNRELAIRPAAVSFPAFKDPVNWAAANDTWNDYNNKKEQTCVPAAAAYLIASWTSNSHTPVNLLPVETVKDTLRLVAPDEDPTIGCHVLDLLKFWRNKGIVGNRIADFRPIKPGDITFLKHAVYCFGGCIIGLDLPESIAESNEWIFNESQKQEKKIGHAVCVLGFDDDQILAISVGQPVKMDAGFYLNFNDESYIVLSKNDWTTTDRDKSPTDPAFNFVQLNELMKQLYNSSFPNP